MKRVDKSAPGETWIAGIRRKFPCEREVDRILTRKLDRRASGPFRQVSLESLVGGIEALLRDRIGDDFAISAPRWLTGGASKLQMAFDLSWRPPGSARVAKRLVLRMEPAESVVETSRRREFEVIKVFEGIVPVPAVHWIDAEGEHLPYPAIIYEFAQGVTKPSASHSNISGLKTAFSPEIRAALAPQFVQHLARIHRFDWHAEGLSAFDRPQAGTTQAVEWQLNWWERVWEEDSGEDVPLMRVAMAWLRRNMPSVAPVCLVHGDYRTGNFLYTEHDNRITALLDWELAHLGDHHEDLAWAAKTIFGNAAEDGKTFLVGGLMPEPAFYEAYERLSGLTVDPKRMAYFKVKNAYQLAAIALGTTYRIAQGGKTHHDVMAAWIVGGAYPILEELRELLENVL